MTTYQWVAAHNVPYIDQYCPFLAFSPTSATSLTLALFHFAVLLICSSAAQDVSSYPVTPIINVTVLNVNS